MPPELLGLEDTLDSKIRGRLASLGIGDTEAGFDPVIAQMYADAADRLEVGAAEVFAPTASAGQEIRVATPFIDLGSAQPANTVEI